MKISKISRHFLVKVIVPRGLKTFIFSIAPSNLLRISHYSSFSRLSGAEIPFPSTSCILCSSQPLVLLVLLQPQALNAFNNRTEVGLRSKRAIF
jgi:hypothetical protein